MKWILPLLILVTISHEARAAWSAGLGYNNPPIAFVGINFMNTFSSDWAGEIGLGYVKNDKDDKDRDATIFAGDLDLKYFVSQGSFRPYVQVGTGWGLSTVLSSTSFTFGELLYGGAGFFVVGSGVYAYASYNLGFDNGFVQAGIGFDL